VAPGAAVVAVVDVLSFTTALSVAVDGGIAVRPYRWRDESAERVARESDAVLAVGRSQAVQPGQVSLSPGSIRRSVGIQRLVLPSPNGATVSAALAETGATVVGVSLRNAAAVAEWVARRLGGGDSGGGDLGGGDLSAGELSGRKLGRGELGGGELGRGELGSGELGGGDAVAVIAAGERWPDGSLRPAVEDLWGAGAFIDHLVRRGVGDISVEAGAALCAYRSVADSLTSALGECASGLELREQGFSDDVAIAAEVGSSRTVPVLVDGWFVAASR
jgi:2-phosphosulfolactate phosphatase